MKATSVLVLMVIVFAAGCSPLAIDSPAATPEPPYSQPPPTPALSPLATVAPTGPGQPYTAEGIEAELSDVPDSFPPGLRTPVLADALAHALWTYDGRPYRNLSLSGSCSEGTVQCELLVSGLPNFAPTGDASDSYVWTFVPSSGVLGPTGGHVLKGYPPELDPELDALARSLDAEGRIASKDFLGATWLPPDGLFVLRYGKGLEEGDPTVLVTLDRDNRRIVSTSTQ